MENVKNSSPDPGSSMTQPALQSAEIVVRRCRPVPYKRHKKSRTGCICCKRRRVKCDEGLPSCGKCRRLALNCEYAQYHNASHPMGSTAGHSIGQPLSQVSPGVIEMIDLRFFHHFLFEAYPPLPILGRQVWQDVAQMSHQYGFLARAMLGLGASHLSLVTSAPHYANHALNHRVASISALNEQLSRMHLKRQDADAALGALLALTFQAAYMPEGMVDFLTTIRGCILISKQGTFNLDDSMFKPLAKDAFVEIARTIVDATDFGVQLYTDFATDFVESLNCLLALCESQAELDYMALMTRIAKGVATNPIESFCEHSFLFNQVGEMSHKDFTRFVDPDNCISQLVLLHVLVLDFVMSRISVDQASKAVSNTAAGQTGFDSRRMITVIWISKVVAALPSSHLCYAERPISFVRRLMPSNPLLADEAKLLQVASRYTSQSDGGST